MKKFSKNEILYGFLCTALTVSVCAWGYGYAALTDSLYEGVGTFYIALFAGLIACGVLPAVYLCVRKIKTVCETCMAEGTSDRKCFLLKAFPGMCFMNFVMFLADARAAGVLCVLQICAVVSYFFWKKEGAAAAAVMAGVFACVMALAGYHEQTVSLTGAVLSVLLIPHNLFLFTVPVVEKREARTFLVTLIADLSLMVCAGMASFVILDGMRWHAASTKTLLTLTALSGTCASLGYGYLAKEGTDRRGRMAAMGIACAGILWKNGMVGCLTTVCCLLPGVVLPLYRKYRMDECVFEEEYRNVERRNVALITLVGYISAGLVLAAVCALYANSKIDFDIALPICQVTSALFAILRIPVYTSSENGLL